jgi:hypothetical protein
MRAFVINCADRLPELITASNRSRSSVLNFTTTSLPLYPALPQIISILAPAARLQRFRNAPNFQGRKRLEALRDLIQHNFGRAASNGQQARIAPQAFNRGAAHVSIAAVNLKTTSDNVLKRLAG